MNMLNNIISFLVLKLLFLIRFTGGKVKYSSIINKDVYDNQSRPTFYFLWHTNAIATIPYTKEFTQKKPMHIVISNSKSTTVMRNAFKILGCNIINGSKSKGYIESIKNVLKTLESEKNPGIAITPDGPRGPELQIENVTLFKIIKKYNTQVRFLCTMSKKIWELNTWDKIMLSKPFSKQYFLNDAVLTDEEIKSKTPEELRQLCEERMVFLFNKIRKDHGLEVKKPGSIKKKRNN